MKSTEWKYIRTAALWIVGYLSVLAATVLIAPNSANAQTAPWEGTSFAGDPKAIAASAQQIKSDSYAEATVLLSEHHLTLDSADRCKLVQHMVYRVETKDGIDGWSTIRVVWSPWHQKKPTIRARVISADGTSHLLDQKTLSEAPAHNQRPEIYEDNRVLSGPLPAVAVGSIVEGEIVSEDLEPDFKGGLMDRYLFARNGPTLHTVLVVEAPKATALRYTTRLLPNVNVTKLERENSTVVTFDQGPMPALEEPEPYLPSDAVIRPAVDISTGATWQTVAAAYQREIEPAIRPQDVTRLMQGASGLTGQALILKLVNNLQHAVRYTGLEFGESSLVPHPAGETLVRGYGDCKDKAVVLVSLLRAAGIRANLALLATRGQDDVNPELIGLGVFDHAIVYVPGNPGTWIDATAEYSQPGVLPWADQGRLALVIGPDTEKLVRIPIAASSDNLLVEKREFHLAPYGPARIVETSIPKGNIESYYRSIYGQSESKSIREELDKYAESAYLADSVTRFDHTSGADLERPFEFSIEMNKGKRGYSSLEDAVVAIPPTPIIGEFPEFMYAQERSDHSDKANQHERRQDVEFPPFITEWQYKITPPTGFGSPSLPEDREIKFGPAVLAQKYRVEKDRSVSAVFRLDSIKARYTPEELKAFRQALADTSADAVVIRFPEVGAAQLAAGNVREALASYNALMKQGPGESLHHVQMAEALLTAGFGDQARAEARKAIGLDPKSALAYAELAWVLQHDAIGRHFGKGFDLQGAVAAYRKSLELDPEQWSTRADLAILLEYDANGERYSAGAQLGQAVEEYHALKKLDKEHGDNYDDNLLLALLYDKQWKQVGETCAQLSSTPARQAIATAAIAAQRGSKAALDEAGRLGLTEVERSNVLVGAADLLVRLRIYPPAADLLNAAAPSQQNSAQVRGRAQMLSAMQPFESMLVPESDPRRVVQQLFIWMMAARPQPDELVKVMDLDTTDDSRAVREQTQEAHKMRSMLEKEGLTGSTVVDIILANTRITSEGSDATGYRIRVAGFSQSPEIALVTRRSGAYHVVSFDGDLAMVGPEVLRRIKANDLPGAKQWLDWGREEQSMQGGDDPLGGPIFPRFWTRGDGADADKMTLAAVSLMVHSSAIAEHVAYLQAARAKAAEKDQGKLDVALAAAYAQIHDWSRMREVAARLLEANPSSDTAFYLMTAACLGLKDWTAWEKIVAARQARLPDDLIALRSSASLASSRGDFVQARSLLRSAIDSGKGSLTDVNNYSWFALFLGKVSADDVEGLEQAITSNLNNTGFAALHTLACLYATTGKGKEARDLLLKAMDTAGYEEPNSEIWLGFASIAQQYGLTDAAVADYQKVEKPKIFDPPDSSYQLAQQRLQGLGKNNSSMTMAEQKPHP